MKTKLLILIGILFPLFVFPQISLNDFNSEGRRDCLNGFVVSYLKYNYSNTFYCLMDNYIKITSANKNHKLTKLEFESGDVTKINDSIYKIIPHKCGRYNLLINGEPQSYRVIEIPEDDIKINFSASSSPFSDCITIDEILKSNELTATFGYKKFKFTHFTIIYEKTNSQCVGETYNDSDSISKDFQKILKKTLEVNGTIRLSDIKIFIYDTTVRVPSKKLKVVDSYQNEFIRRTLKLSPETNDLNIVRNDLRIKITGCHQKEILIAVNKIANELNGILETIKVRIVDKQPSLTLNIDTITDKTGFDGKAKFDSSLIAQGYNYFFGGYIKEIRNSFFPFSRRFIMYFKNICSCSDLKDDSILFQERAYSIIKTNLISLLINNNSNKIEKSFFNWYTYPREFSVYESYLLKTLYSKGGEEKILSILNEEKVEKQKSPVYMLLLVLTIILLFVFSEIYNYYNLTNIIGKVRIKIIKRIIEAIFVAQIPIIAYLILEWFNNGIKTLFHEFLFLESMLIPFCILIGIFFYFLDKLLKKIKFLWLNILANLTLSFFSVALAYQLMYFFITPELIKLSLISWEILLIPLLITLYRLYARFQTNKIAGLLQEKELELSKQKELKFKSDLNALQARINPHFLYNALNSLASLTYIDQKRTEKMALSLSKLFRYNINKTEEHYASLKDEIEMAEIYLQIEKNRFEDKLNYNIEIQEELKEFKIPRFILQPLAENAVKHGISKITGQGFIKIKIFEAANKVIIEIYDNGPEFPGGLISGYGLQNTYEKLKLLYKKAFDISFVNTPEKKLVITLTK